MKAKFKCYVSLIGIVVTIIGGWIIPNADHFPFVYRVLAPKYSNSISAFNKMHQENFILKEGNSGFPEISEVLKGYMKNTPPLITQLKTLNWGTDARSTPGGIKWRNYIELEVSFASFPRETGKFYDLGSKIEETYLTSNFFMASSIFFWVGIIIVVIGRAI